MTNPLTLFQKPERPTHMKVGIYGNAGSGKTYTSSLIAIGIVKELKSKKPVYIFDTETGSDWLGKVFADHGVEFRVLKSRSFVDLLEAVKVAEKEASVLIVDSISHVWMELIDAYLKRLGKNQIPMPTWGVIKKQWAEFTTLYLNTKLHIIVCGRAKGEYEYVLNEDTGKKEFREVDTRMGGEKEMAYEPSLLLEMHKVKEYDKTGKHKIVIHRAEVQKDRSDTLNKAGTIDDPNFESLRSVWAFLNIGGQNDGIDTTRNSESLVYNPDKNIQDRILRRKVACENIQNAMIEFIPGRGAEDQKAKVGILTQAFGTASWTAIEQDWNKVPLEKLEEGVDKVRELAAAYMGMQQKEKAKPKTSKGGKK